MAFQQGRLRKIAIEGSQFLGNRAEPMFGEDFGLTLETSCSPAHESSPRINPVPFIGLGAPPKAA